MRPPPARARAADVTEAEERPLSRRAFVMRGALAAALLGGAGGIVAGGRRALAQGRAPVAPPNEPAGGGGLDSSNLFEMDQSASRPVRMAPKPGVHPVLGNDERDALEHRIRCQCGCTLDVYTCRTTDFSCQVSPAMHADIVALVQGGYGAEEIIAAFVRAYGEKVLMAPTKDGFNLFGWVAPFAALAIGAGVVASLIVKWRGRAPIAAAGAATSAGSALRDGATADELARLERAVRDDR